MLSLEKSEKLFWGLKWFGIVLLAMLVAWKVPQGVHLIDGFLAKCASTLGGNINLGIAYVILALLPAVPFILLRLKPVSLIAVTIALFPLLSRLRPVFGIYAYTTFYGAPHLISGLALLIPLLFGYLLFRYPVIDRGWWLPSSKAFWLLAASGVMTQFAFFSPFSAIRIAYLVIVVQLLWYLIIVAYVNTMEDVYKLIWGIVTAVIISILLTTFTTGEQGTALFNPESFVRLESNSMGSCNEYGVLMTSALCLLPILYYRSHGWAKIMILACPLFFGKELLLTGTRGAYLSLLPILGYFFVFQIRKKQIISLAICFVIAFSIIYDQLLLYLAKHPIYFDARLFQIRSVQERILNSVATLRALMTWPYFFTGFGMGTFGNWDIPGTLFGHCTHQGFLWVWVNSGLAGFLGFIYWIGYSLWAGVKKILRSHELEEKLVLSGLVLSIVCWIILFVTTKGMYTGGPPELYAILTTEVGLLVALNQKPRFSKP